MISPKAFPKRIKPLGAVALLFAASAVPSFAQAAVDESEAAELQADSGGDIIVTAQRRETSLLETPLAVTAIGGDALASGHIETLADLAGKLPGVNLPNGYANMQSIYIRGIGTNDPGVPAAVGIYIDDVYVPRTFGNGLFDLPDVERIEVLRGPQGTLYGQNTSAGAVKLVSKRPSETLTGTLYAEYGNYDGIRTQAYLSGPLVDGLLYASVAYTHRERRGHTYNANTARWVDRLNTDQGRLKLLFTPASNFEAQLTIDKSWDDSDNLVGIPLNFGTHDPRVTYANTDTRLNRDAWGAALHLKLDLSDTLTVKSISGYRTVRDHPSPWDWDGTPVDRFGWVQTLRSKQYSQELQLLGDNGPLTWTLGAIYLRETFAFDRLTWRTSSYSEIESHLKTDSFGLYGQASFNLTDRLTVTAGLRYGEEKQDFTNLSYTNRADGSRTGLIYSVTDLKDKSDALTPKFGVDYKLSDTALLYASFTRGTKSGGFNRAAGTALIASIPVAPESVTAYEIGFKGRTDDRVLQGSVAAFYNDFKDYQANISNPTIGGQLINGQVVVNAGAAETYGAEAEFTLRPIKGLAWQVSASWLKTRFLSFANPTGAAASDYTGNKLPLAPEWTLGTDVDYALPLGIPGEISLNAGVDYRTDTYLDAANNPATKLKDQVFVDLGVSYRTDDGRWTFQVLAKNLFDATTVIGPHFLTPSIGVDVVGYSLPRLVTASIRYSF
jgi:iron complex outermembrane receptor protein